MQDPHQRTNPVVASLAKISQHPYSSIALSPDGKYAIVAAKDSLRVLSVGPSGLTEVRNVRVSQRFVHTSVTAPAPNTRYDNLRDTFNLNKMAGPPLESNSNADVTDVAWSNAQPDGTEFIAAAGSNGVVVVWNAHDFVTAANSNGGPPPAEAVLSQHSRAVNRLAWHPSADRAGWLLTASQDSSAKCWERRAESTRAKQPDTGPRSWFGGPSQEKTVTHNYSWHCRPMFQLNSEHVRDIRWSPFHHDFFAAVTDNGTLHVYNVHLPGNYWAKIAAHTGEATTVDWHPTLTYVIATGGVDRTVKIWDLEDKINLNKMDCPSTNMALNSCSARSELSSNGDSATDDTIGRINSVGSTSISSNANSSTLMLSGSTFRSGTGSSSANANLIHTLSISASVTKAVWRPPAGDHVAVNIHSSMLAVSTAPIKGASAGGNGLLGLWSFRRPFMPLSIVEGHTEGNVTDFVWLDTPSAESTQQKYEDHELSLRSRELYSQTQSLGMLKPPKAHRHYSEGDEEPLSAMSTKGTWQHVLSVGRDGRCILQSFARGNRPISNVSPSCFAMANLSPFQRGYGSLQIFSVHQQIPSCVQDNFLLTGLRRDLATAIAPGVFREVPLSVGAVTETSRSKTPDQRFPASSPTLTFNVIDQGDLDDNDNPVVNEESLTIAPEVVHLSRFANSYKLYPDECLTTRVELCTHNATVAQRLQRHALAHMWRTVASILKGANLDVLPPRGTRLNHPLQFALLPTMKSLLEERGDAGDVQTCVALCELLQVLDNADAESQETRIPGLELNLVREWYLSYIDLLQQMCLFSHACFLIRSCNDRVVGALNQQSTTFHESCPHCGKAVHGSDADSTGNPAIVARRTCHSCRRRIGMCFLCHEPVTGIFVWCPGCGHGGHLDHALEWFGGMSGKPVREVCPTGCGHKCNLTQQLNSFPRTDSFIKCVEIGND